MIHAPFHISHIGGLGSLVFPGTLIGLFALAVLMSFTLQ
jgi:hypothetical protein